MRSGVVAAAADRPIWYPGNTEVVPEYRKFSSFKKIPPQNPPTLPLPPDLLVLTCLFFLLLIAVDGTLAGDYGFDPIGLGSSPEQLAWNVQAELVHGRTAMTAVAGILFTSLAHHAGADIPEWYEAGKVYMQQHPEVSFGALVWTTFALSGWAEFKRLQDIRNPGSQADGSFLGITDDFKGVSNGYPGGKFFDPMGLSRGDPAKYEEYKQKEIKNGRLAMVAFIGFIGQHQANGLSPLGALNAHLSSPFTQNFAEGPAL